MLGRDALLVLPFDRQYGLAAVQYAGDVLALPGLKLDGSPFDFLRDTMAEVVVEMALRRWLEQAGMRYDLPGWVLVPRRPWALTLGGRRCALQVVRADGGPDALLAGHVTLSLEKLNHPELGGKDIFMFGAVTGSGDLPASEPLFWYVLPWGQWVSRAGVLLSPLRLHSPGKSPAVVYLGGLDAEGKSLQVEVRLHPGERVTLPYDLRTLVYLRTSGRPAGMIEVQGAAGKLRTRIRPDDWHDVSLNAAQAVVLGWLNSRDFRAASRVVATGETGPLVSRMVATQGLRPVGELVGLLRQGGWG